MPHKNKIKEKLLNDAERQYRKKSKMNIVNVWLLVKVNKTLIYFHSHVVWNIHELCLIYCCKIFRTLCFNYYDITTISWKEPIPIYWYFVEAIYIFIKSFSRMELKHSKSILIESSLYIVSECLFSLIFFFIVYLQYTVFHILFYYWTFVLISQLKWNLGIHWVFVSKVLI